MDSFDRAVMEAVRRNSSQIMVALGDDLVTDIKDIFAAHFFKQMNEMVEGKIHNVQVRTRDDRIKRIAMKHAEEIVRKGLEAVLKEGKSDGR